MPVIRAAIFALAAGLAAVYLGSAVTMPAGHGELAVLEAAIGASQVGWMGALKRWPHQRATLAAGIVLQLGLAALWVISRTAGLPGQGRLPVGELDLFCLADELVAAGLALRCVYPSTLGSRVPAIVPCQAAVTLASITLFLWGGGHAHGATQAKVSWASGSHQHFFCHLL